MSSSANYTYHLAKNDEVKQAYGHRLTCPNCGRPRCFVPYVDAWGEPITTEVGKCDHQNSCGYHYTPGDYFRDHKDGVRRVEAPKHVKPIKPLRSYIIDDVYRKTLGNYDRNTLARWLYSLMPQEADKAIMEFRLGTSKNGSAVFWQFDTNNMCRGGKVMLYDPNNGHRVKVDGNGRVNWAHTLMKLENFNMEQCLYGLHRLKDNTDKPVAIFESEKTAILAAMILDQQYPCVPMATGGAGGLSKDKMLPLRGRDVVIFPDEGMFAEWYDKASQMQWLFKSLRISDLCEKGNYCHTGDGCDMGDYLVQHVSDIDKELIDIHIEASMVDIV